MGNQLYPLLIPTLCRYKHFKNCVDSLGKNSYANQVVLYVALDYPTKDEHWDGYNKIVDYLGEVDAFAEVRIIKRSKNIGAGFNFFKAVDELFEKYEMLIYSEDDNVFAPNFIEYTIKCLNEYKDNPNILAVCGYKLPKDFPQTDATCIQMPLFNAWGGGFWKDKYISFKNQLGQTELKKYLTDIKIVKKILLKRPFSLWYMLVLALGKDEFMADTMISIKCLIEHKMCVFPTISKSANNGMDGSGAHYTIDNGKYKNQILDNNTNFNIIEPTNNKINRLYTKRWFSFDKMSFYQWYWMITRYIKFRLISK